MKSVHSKRISYIFSITDSLQQQNRLRILNFMFCCVSKYRLGIWALKNTWPVGTALHICAWRAPSHFRSLHGANYYRKNQRKKRTCYMTSNWHRSTRAICLTATYCVLVVKQALDSHTNTFALEWTRTFTTELLMQVHTRHYRAESMSRRAWKCRQRQVWDTLASASPCRECFQHGFKQSISKGYKNTRPQQQRYKNIFESAVQVQEHRWHGNMPILTRQGNKKESGQWDETRGDNTCGNINPGQKR